MHADIRRKPDIRFFIIFFWESAYNEGTHK